jgi:hypothetical protein
MPSRPKSLKEVAQQASTLEAWGYGLAEFLDEVKAVRRTKPRAAILELVREEPPILSSRFDQGETADAFAAALAEYLAQSEAADSPAWTRGRARFLDEAWFPLRQIAGQPHLRGLIERETPRAFRDHNVFIDENSLVRA